MSGQGRAPDLDRADAVLSVHRQIEWAAESTGLLLALRNGLARAEALNSDARPSAPARKRRVAWSEMMQLVNRLACTALVRQVIGHRWMCRSGAVVKVWDAAVVEHDGSELVVRIVAGRRCEVDCVVMLNGAVASGSLLVLSADALLDRWRARR